MLNLLGLTDFHTFPKTCENTLRETVLTVKALSVPSWHSITTAICCLETRTVFLFPWWLLRLFLVSFPLVLAVVYPSTFENGKYQPQCANLILTTLFGSTNYPTHAVKTTKQITIAKLRNKTKRIAGERRRKNNLYTQ